jgi:hypothetical protein
MLKREEANLLLIELNRMPERPGLAARDAAIAIKRAIVEHGDVSLSASQAVAIRRAIEGLRIKRRNLPSGLSALRNGLALPANRDDLRLPTDVEAPRYGSNVA